MISSMHTRISDASSQGVPPPVPLVCSGENAGSSPQASMPHSSRSFTLVELVAVIGIIAVLAGLLLPAINAVRDSARAATCGSNLRQIGLAINAYADGNEEMLPYMHPGDESGTGANVGRWSALLINQDLISVPNWSNPADGIAQTGVFRCPGVASDTIRVGGGYGYHTGSRHGAGMCASHSDPAKRIRLRSAYSQPSQSIMVADAVRGDIQKTHDMIRCPLDAESPWTAGSGQWFEIPGRHRKRGILVLLDGHVERALYSDLKNDVLGMWNHPEVF